MNFKSVNSKKIYLEKGKLDFIFCSLFFLHLCLPSLKKWGNSFKPLANKW
jgi:hypothetical protein